MLWCIFLQHYSYQMVLQQKKAWEFYELQGTKGYYVCFKTYNTKTIGKNERIELQKTRVWRSLLLVRSILFYILTEHCHPITQYRIGLISEVIVYNSYWHCHLPILYSCFSQFLQSYPLKSSVCTCFHNFLTTR